MKVIERAAIAVVPDKKEKNKTVLLDDRLLLAPSFAIAECYRQTIKMAEIVGNKSVGSCGIWFNQPVVPDKMKK